MAAGCRGEAAYRCAAHSRAQAVLALPRSAVRAARKELGVVPSMKRVDTCAAEFEAGTPYMYSSYDGECECEPTNNRKVISKCWVGLGRAWVPGGSRAAFWPLWAEWQLRGVNFVGIPIQGPCVMQ